MTITIKLQKRQAILAQNTVRVPSHIFVISKYK